MPIQISNILQEYSLWHMLSYVVNLKWLADFEYLTLRNQFFKYPFQKRINKMNEWAFSNFKSLANRDPLVLVQHPILI